MSKEYIECEHEWIFTVPYRPSDSSDIIHVEVEANCDKCEEERTSDYSWEIDRYHTVIKEGEQEVQYICDECCSDMDNEGKYADGDLHFCSKECNDSYWGEEE